MNAGYNFKYYCQISKIWWHSEVDILPGKCLYISKLQPEQKEHKINLHICVTYTIIILSSFHQINFVKPSIFPTRTIPDVLVKYIWRLSHVYAQLKIWMSLWMLRFQIKLGFFFIHPFRRNLLRQMKKN